MDKIPVSEKFNLTIQEASDYFNIGIKKELKEMFFSLDLIQSYGSGIRRAKKAMADNSSPALIFEPNNDVDDYTMATAYINDEFARVQLQKDRRGENLRCEAFPYRTSGCRKGAQHDKVHEGRSPACLSDGGRR